MSIKPKTFQNSTCNTWTNLKMGKKTTILCDKYINHMLAQHSKCNNWLQHGMCRCVCNQWGVCLTVRSISPITALLYCLRPPQGDGEVKLVFTTFENLLPLEQCHHKPMGMYGVPSLPRPYIPMSLWCSNYNGSRIIGAHLELVPSFLFLYSHIKSICTFVYLIYFHLFLSFFLLFFLIFLYLFL